MSSYSGKAFDLLRGLPRISLQNLKPNPGATQQSKRSRNRGSKTHGAGKKYRQNAVPAGFESGKNQFYKKFPDQNWRNYQYSKLSYNQVNLQTIQQLVDLGRIRTDIPVDVTQLVNTGKQTFSIDPDERQAGFLLEDDDNDCFVAKLNLEVQYAANESVIAAVEKAGGTITTAYYDPISLAAAVNPIKFFNSGHAIPRRMLPPQSLIDYYSDPKQRGYLADPDLVAKERLVLAQKYGYDLPNLDEDPDKEMLMTTKDPRQIFYGLEPGWIVNLADKIIIKSNDKKLKQFYAS